MGTWYLGWWKVEAILTVKRVRRWSWCGSARCESGGECEARWGNEAVVLDQKRDAVVGKARIMNKRHPEQSGEILSTQLGAAALLPLPWREAGDKALSNGVGGTTIS